MPQSHLGLCCTQVGAGGTVMTAFGQTALGQNRIWPKMLFLIFLGVFNIFGRAQHFCPPSSPGTHLPRNPSSPGPSFSRSSLPGPPTFSFFFSSPPQCSFCLPSWPCVFEGRDPQICAFGLSGCRANLDRFLFFNIVNVLLPSKSKYWWFARGHCAATGRTSRALSHYDGPQFHHLAIVQHLTDPSVVNEGLILNQIVPNKDSSGGRKCGTSRAHRAYSTFDFPHVKILLVKIKVNVV